MSTADLEVERELEAFCAAEARRWRTRAVILFGSRARRQHMDDSDADVCVIAEGLPEDLFRRRYPAPSGYRYLSVFGFRPEEFLDLVERANPFVLELVCEGRLLHDDGFFRLAQAAFEKAKVTYNIRRTERGWDWEPKKVPAG